MQFYGHYGILNVELWILLVAFVVIFEFSCLVLVSGEEHSDNY